MNSQQKIEEWIKQAEERPESALMILKLIAGRLRDLSERDEEILAENIALQNGSHVEEYQKRIAHLEYQLDLLKRRFGEDALESALLQPALPATEQFSVLVYHASGRIIRLIAARPELTDRAVMGQISGTISPRNEWPRLLVVPSEEELLLLFNSGRVSTCPVMQIPALETGGSWSWEQGALPDEPHGGELLSSLMPLTPLPLADFFMQVSRRGCIKKTMTSVGETILSNHYMGRGTVQKADQPFDVRLCNKKARLALVTYEGRLLGLDVDEPGYSAEERIRLEPHDHVVGTSILEQGGLLLCLTQTGKVVSREADSIEMTKSANTRGQALISPARLDQGTRFVSAAGLRASDAVLVLDGAGRLTAHAYRELGGAGRLPEDGLALALGVVPAAPEESRA
jgi:DNA gyrase/topoisomerase IV subunit A